MPLTTWRRVTPEQHPSSTDKVQPAKQQRLTEYGLTMPEQQEVTETLTVEEAQEIASEYNNYGSTDREVLARLERISGEDRSRWEDVVRDVRDNVLAFKAMNIDPDFPNNSLRSIKDPEEWEILDPMDITKVVCSATEKELWEVELPDPTYNEMGPEETTYVDDGGNEYGGMYVTDQEAEYFDVAFDSDEFVNGRILNDMEPRNTGSTSLIAFVPGDDGVDKIRVEKIGTIRRDIGSNDESYESIREHPEVESLVNAIIRSDEEDDGLEGWVPVEARPEEGSSRAMERKVEEIAETPPDDYYFDFPTVAVLGREGAITGKRYVAVPEEHSEDADDWFDPDLY